MKRIYWSLFILISLIYIGSITIDAPPWVFVLITGLTMFSYSVSKNLSPSKENSQTNIAAVKTDQEASDATLQLMEQYVKELEMAKNVQQGLLKVEDHDVPGLSISTCCIPAENVGGDFFAIINRVISGGTERKSTPGVVEYIDRNDQYVGIAIGDVAGHGLGSALVMALSSAILRENSMTINSPAKVLEQCNNTIQTYIKNSHISYVTVFYGIINTVTRQFTYSKAGHPSILYFPKGGAVQELETSGVFLGMFDNEVYEEKSIQLNSGDRLVFYTDGLTEAKNNTHEQYGVDRFIDILNHHRNDKPDLVKNNVLDDVADFSDGAPIQDDQTLVIVDID